MRLEEVARELDISRASVFKLISAGKLPVIRYGQRMVRVHREDLIAYVEGLRAGEPAARGGRA